MTRMALLLTTTFSLGILPLTAQNKSIYVSDAGNFSQPPWQILKFDENGENREVFIDDHLAWPQDILFLEGKNEVLITNLNSGRISRFNATTGEFINEFATGIGGPTRMKIGADGLLYVLQWSGNGKVWRYQPDGTFVDQFTATGVGTSIGLDWDAVGNLYVSSYNGKLVKKFSSTGADMGLFINTNLVGPTNIWFEDNGDLLVMDYDGGAVKRFNSDGEYQGIFIPDLPQGEGVDFLPNGNIIIGCGGTSSVRVYNQFGSFIEDLVPPGTLDLLKPNAVVFRVDPISGTTTPIVYKEVALATPSIGTLFHITAKALLLSKPRLDVLDAAGIMVRSLNLADTMQFDATGLADGIYFLTVQLQEGAIGRQKIVVQR